MKKFILSTISLAFALGVTAQNSYWSIYGNNATKNYKLGTTNNTDLRLYTYNAERLRITSGGNVGIGVYNNLYAKLHVYNNYGIGIYSSGKTYGAQFYGGDYGVYGTGKSYGVWGQSKYIGVYGNGDSYGLYGYSGGSSGYGLYAEANYVGGYGSGNNYGFYGYTPGGSNYQDPNYPAGVFGYNASYGYGTGGYCVNGSGIFGYSEKYYAGYFDGDVYTTGSYLPSDRALKQNISDMTSGMDIVRQLHPKSYNFRQDGNYKFMHLPAGRHYGLVTEDLEQVLPTLVKATQFDTRMATSHLANSKSTKPAAAQAGEIIAYKALNYTELIPILIKAIQEQQVTIDNQNARIDALTQRVNQQQSSSPEASVKLSGVSLGNSIPNPAANSARINYSIPLGTTAELMLTNAAGQKIRQIHLNSSGLVDVDTSSLSAGTYFYTMYVREKAIDTKKLIVVK